MTFQIGKLAAFSVMLLVPWGFAPNSGTGPASDGAVSETSPYQPVVPSGGSAGVINASDLPATGGWVSIAFTPGERGNISVSGKYRVVEDGSRVTGQGLYFLSPIFAEAPMGGWAYTSPWLAEAHLADADTHITCCEGFGWWGESWGEWYQGYPFPFGPDEPLTILIASTAFSEGSFLEIGWTSDVAGWEPSVTYNPGGVHAIDLVDASRAKGEGIRLGGFWAAGGSGPAEGGAETERGALLSFAYYRYGEGGADDLHLTVGDESLSRGLSDFDSYRLAIAKRGATVVDATLDGVESPDASSMSSGGVFAALFIVDIDIGYEPAMIEYGHTWE